MPTIYETLRADIITAMKARDSSTTTALRTADAAIKRAAMDANKEIDDPLVIATIRKAVKNLADAKVEFEKGGRADLVAANEAEIRILEKYLPAGTRRRADRRVDCRSDSGDRRADEERHGQSHRRAEETPGSQR